MTDSPDPDLPDEETLRTGRAGVRRFPGGASRYPSVLPDDTPPAATLPAASPSGGLSADTDAAASLTDSDGPLRRRSTYIDVTDDEHAADGSTIVARRESRRRAAREEDPGSADGTSGVAPPATPGRAAAPPDATADAVYRARRSEAVAVSRTPRPERLSPPSVDVAAPASGRRLSPRRTAVIVVISASAVALLASASLIAITLFP